MQAVEIAGQRFGRLVAISRSEKKNKKGQYFWLCRCDCGNEKLVIPTDLRHGIVKSCGCLNKETSSKVMKNWHEEHPENRQTHGGAHSRLYTVWNDMRVRCRDPKSNSYPRYGGRGIKVCEEWQSFENFRKWAIQNGYDSKAKRGACTLDRIDNDGNYEPSNCKWSDTKEQSRNRRSSRFITIDGETRTANEWAEVSGIPYQCFLHRINYYGWTIEKALTTPVQANNNSKRRKYESCNSKHK